MNLERKTSDAKIKANMKYSAKTYKRIPLDVKIKSAEILKEYCASIDTGVNTFIKEAIKEKFFKDTGNEIDL